MNLPKFAIANRVTTTAIMILLLAWGTMAFFSVSRRENPEITIRSSLLVIAWPGASAEKIEQLVTLPLERAIKEIAEVKRISSDSRVGLSAIIIRLHDNVMNTDMVWSKIRAKISRVEPQLPKGCLSPDFNTDFGEVAVMVLAMYQTPILNQKEIVKPYSMREMDDMLKDVEDILQEIPMVGKIEKFGLQKEVIYIEADARDWGQMAVQGQKLAQILDMRNTIAPGGTISGKNIDYALKPSGEFLRPNQIKSVVVGSKRGAPIHLGDLDLAVSRRYVEPKTTFTRLCSPDYPLNKNRADCVVLALTMRKSYNVVALGETVREKLANDCRRILPPDIKIEIVNDTPRQVDSVISDFLNNLWQAVGLVLLVAFLMIGPRISLIMAAAIPLCLITAIGFMGIFNVDLEQCSIAALIIVLGMLVDNAVVISDNVLRLINMGYPKTEACWRGAQELLLPILTSTLTTVAAFLPMLTISTDTGEYIRSLPILVSTALLVSFFVAMTITPMMCAIILVDKEPKKRAEAKRKAAEERKTGKIMRQGLAGWYGRFMIWAIKHKQTVFATALGLLMCSLALATSIGTAFFPKALRNQFVIEIELPAGSSASQTERVVRQVEDILLSSNQNKAGKSRLKNALSYIGKSGPRFFLTIDQEPNKVYYAQMMVNTTSKWYTHSFIQDIRLKLERIANARVVVKSLDMGPPVKTPISLRLRGKNPQKLLQLAQQVKVCLEKVKGTRNVHDSWGSMSCQLAIDINEDAANLAGVTNLGVASALYGYFSGYKVTTYREGRHQIDVLLRVKPEQRNNLDYLDYLYVEGLYGKVPLNAVAKVKQCWQVSLIQRRNLIRTIEVRSFIEPGYLSNKIIAQALPLIREKVQFPPGYFLEIGGEYEKTKESEEQVIVALEISLVLIVFTLIIQFNSFIKPLIILLTMPLALIGAISGLWISGWPLGFMPMLGMVSLCGVVVNNAIVLVDFIQSSVADGMPLSAAVIRSGQYRMRPILITTMTTVGGFLPLALFGGPLWQGLAYVMIFGLLASTALTLVLIPLVYILFAEHLGMKEIAKTTVYSS